MRSSPAVDPATLGLIIRLQSKEYLKGFHLVGGTALALLFGHRRSIDIDLFSDTSFDTMLTMQAMQTMQTMQGMQAMTNQMVGFL